MSTRQTNIPQWVIPFCKILEMEEAHGFIDSAVVGGLDRFVQRWAQPMSEYIPGPELLTELTHSQYSGMSATERQAWVTCWRNVLFSEHQSWGDLGLLRTASSGNKPAPTVNPDSKQAQDAPMSVGNSDERSVVLPSSRAVPIAPLSLSVDAPVDRLRGVDTKLTEKFKRLDVSTIRDLLYLFPRRYNDFSNIAKISELQPGQEYTVAGQLWEARQITMGQQGRLKATEAVLSDETGNVKIIWFGQGYLARSLKPNSRLAVSGKVDVFKGQLVFESPEYDILSSSQPPLHTGRIVPVYPLTEGITGRNMRRLTWQALDSRIGDVAEAVPAAILKRTRLMPLQDAIAQAHYPDDEPHQGDARRRLAFDELFILQLAVLSRRRDRDQGVAGIPIEVDQQILNGFIASLPFSLTGAQRRCVDEILEDLRRGVHPMNRLLQGEVGSGKTVVVLVALLAVAASGYQGAIMVPTEVLAEQHFHTISRLLAGLARPMQENNLITAYLDTLGRPISVGLLTGSTRARVRKQLVQMAAEGTLDLLVGTHALIQADVDVPKLALAVMDEQHRFGVMQRSALRQRGLENPHSLVMSATPIPRTLSLTLYGDLDISTIDELPPGRQFVQTRWVGPERRLAAYGFLRKQVEEGRQAFIIYPLIDESDTIEARAATDEYKRLSNDVFQDLRLGLLHGRMSAKDKDKVMRQFRDGEVDILVSTAVVEVGIDVANATVMMIDGADRFGLSQLHQFRGRVGRGEHKSYCLLLSDSPSDVAIERLSALEQIHDGFKLAEVDLELRGPGDFFGTRQSGLPNLRMAQLSDRELLAMARTEATLLMESDPALDKPENLALKQQVGRFLDRVSAEFS